MPGPTEIFPSADSAVDPSGSGIALTTLYPTEFLNSINIGGFPLHHLALKVGCPIMLLRNLDPTTGMCNGTRLIVSVTFGVAIFGLRYIPSNILLYRGNQARFQELP